PALDRRALRLPRTVRHEGGERASPGRNTGMKKAPCSNGRRFVRQGPGRQSRLPNVRQRGQDAHTWRDVSSGQAVSRDACRSASSGRRVYLVGDDAPAHAAQLVYVGSETGSAELAPCVAAGECATG